MKQLKINGTPAGNRILIKKLTEEEYTKLKSGVIVPRSEGERPADKGTILAVGDDVKKAKVGNVVFFNQGYGSGAFPIQIEGENCILVKEEAIEFYIK